LNKTQTQKPVYGERGNKKSWWNIILRRHIFSLAIIVTNEVNQFVQFSSEWEIISLSVLCGKNCRLFFPFFTFPPRMII